MEFVIGNTQNTNIVSFVTYKLKKSEFCRYLNAQIEKHELRCNETAYNRMPYRIMLNENSLYARFRCWIDGMLINENYTYTRSEMKHDAEMMSEKFLEVIGEILPLEKIDEPKKLYDTFVNDIKNKRLECYLVENFNEQRKG